MYGWDHNNPRRRPYPEPFLSKMRQKLAFLVTVRTIVKYYSTTEKICQPRIKKNNYFENKLFTYSLLTTEIFCFKIIGICYVYT